MTRDTGDSQHLPRFDVDVVVEPADHRLRVRGTVVVPPAAEAREKLDFLLRTDTVGPRIEALDPPGCRGVLEVRSGERVPDMAATQRFEASLGAPCPPRVPLVLSVEYDCGSHENRRWLSLTSEFCFSSYYASAWIPMFGFRRGTGTLRYSVPEGMVVLATGDLRGAVSQEGRLVSTFVTDIPSVFDFVAGPFEVRHRQGRVPVSVYHLEPLDRVEEILERTERILGALEDEFGPYPFRELAVVEAPMGPATFAGLEGGAYPGYFLIRSDLLQADSLEDWVVGHELTHFWFPHVVGHRPEPIAPAMLDEALAHYGAIRVVEALNGSAAAEQFRREGGKEAIRLTAAGFDHALAGTSATERWDRVAYNLSNTKGHLVYDMLARTIGRERFGDALRRVIGEHAGGDIGWADFWATVQQVGGQSLEWFSNQWLEGSSIPVLSLEWSQEDDRLTCVVSQSEPHFRLVLPLQVEWSDGSARMYSIELVDEESRMEIVAESTVHDVRLDPHFTVLHATPSIWAEAKARRFVTRGVLLREDDDFDQALDMFRRGLAALPEPDVWGIECLTRIHIGGLHQDQGRLEEASAEYERALACAIRPADSLGRLYLNMAKIAEDAGDTARAAWAAGSVFVAEQALGRATGSSAEARSILQRLGTRAGF